LLRSSEAWKKKEFDLFNKADVIHVVGSYEQQVVQKEVGSKPVRNIPLYIYENILNDINKDFSQRKDIIFVGGFGHPPNIDAVLWFGKEIFPKILEQHPDIKWYVVGSKVTPEIQALASDNIIIKGFVEDSELEQMYRQCRVAVVPLRVGAGVKGKVVEAAYYQIPLVTTTIGAEGLSMEEGAFLVEDNANNMAQMICELYEDYDRLRMISDSGVDFIQKYFMINEAERILKLDF
jgi:glycosyltransferase involved in cell wall biosynthesis